MMPHINTCSLVVVMAMVGASPAWAQGLVEVRERGQFGIGATLAVPVGEFDEFVGLGGGIELHGVVNLGSEVIGLRFNGSAVGYGYESFERPLSLTIPRVIVDVHTTNWITSFGGGPQLAFRTGPFRPYVYGTVGFSYFATVSSVSGYHHETTASSTNFDDFTFATSAGAGVMIELARKRDKTISADIAVQGTHNGVTRYLRPGSIGERSDGSLYIVPIESNANLITVKAGVTIGVF